MAFSAKQDLTVTGTIENWEIDTVGAFLAVGRDLTCQNLVAGGADIRVRRDLKADNAVVSTYNHGYMEISRDVIARHFIIDDHFTIVGRNIKASGWKESSAAEVFDFPTATGGPRSSRNFATSSSIRAAMSAVRAATSTSLRRCSPAATSCANGLDLD